MIAKFFVILVLAVSVYAAEEEERVKKDVLLGTIPGYTTYSAAIPATYSYAHTYDGVKYIPAKYAFTKPAVYAPAAVHSPAAAVLPAAGPVVPAAATVSAYSTHSVHPLPYTGYAYPYHYGAYPYVKTYPYVY